MFLAYSSISEKVGVHEFKGFLLNMNTFREPQSIFPFIAPLTTRGSFYAKHLSRDTTITIALRIRNQDEVLGSQQIRVADPLWTKYTFTLQVPDGKLHRLDPADFVVEVAGDERVELDQLSLMPADARSGLDPDAVALAKEMKTKQ